VLWTHHHILMDGWCLPILLQEVLTAYQALRRRAAPLFEPVAPYRHHIVRLLGQDQAEAERFWRKALKGVTTPTVLGEEVAPEEAGQHRSSGTAAITLSPETSAQLRTFAQGHHVTLNTLVQGAWRCC
jgi:hypothetical protein